jgi:chromate reductase, NAD(P)H dehydrogenase (quinone)
MTADRSTTGRVLVVSGSTRNGSTNTAFCRTAAAHPPDGIVVECFAAIASLPHFDPDDDHDPLPAPVVAVRSAIAAADAVLFCTPEYAGTLPGSFKNLLDWTVGATVLNDKPAGWANVALDPERGHGAHATLATVLGYVQARVMGGTGWHVPITRDQVDAEGLVTDAAVVGEIRRVIGDLLAPAT